MKGNIGWQYSKGTYLSIAKTRLESEFQLLDSDERRDLISNTIRHVDKRISEIEEEIKKKEEALLPTTLLSDDGSSGEEF